MIEELKNIDPEIRELVKVLNFIPSLETTCSCCGHDKEPIRIWFNLGLENAIKVIFYFFNGLNPKIWSIKISTADPHKSSNWLNCYLESSKTISQMKPEIEKLERHIKKVLIEELKK